MHTIYKHYFFLQSTGADEKIKDPLFSYANILSLTCFTWIINCFACHSITKGLHFDVSLPDIFCVVQIKMMCKMMISPTLRTIQQVKGYIRNGHWKYRLAINQYWHHIVKQGICCSMNTSPQKEKSKHELTYCPTIWRHVRHHISTSQFVKSPSNRTIR